MNFLKILDELIASRKKNYSSESYTSQLLEQGVDRIARKLGEETAELIVAAKNDNKEELCNEAGDLLYHLMVLCHNQGVSFEDVVTVMEKRHTS